MRILRTFVPVLAASLLLTSCSAGAPGETDSVTVIKADDPWFDTETVDIDYDNEYSLLDVYKDKTSVILRTQSNVPDNVWRRYDLSGEHIMDYNEKDLREPGQIVSSERFYEVSDNSYLMYYLTDDKTGVDYGPYVVRFGEGGFTDKHQIEAPSLGNARIEKIYQYGSDIAVLAVNDSSGDEMPVIHITDEGFNIKKSIDLSPYMIDMFYDSYSFFCPTGDHSFVVQIRVPDGFVMFEADTSAGTVSRIDGDWIDQSPGSFYDCADGHIYECNMRGIREVNVSDRKSYDRVDFDNCYINSWKVSEGLLQDGSAVVLGGDGDSVTVGFGNDLQVSGGNLSSRFTIIIFTRAAANPNAGKKVIRAANTSIEDMGSFIGEAIMSYNKNDPDNYIVVRNEEDIKEAVNYDIILGSIARSEINRDSLMTDLKPMISDDPDISDDDYYMNVFSAFEDENGRLYQLPLEFDVKGICAPSDSFPGTGMSFEEYAAFVKDKCNGNDPVLHPAFDLSVSDYAEILFANSYDMFVKGGKIDVDNDAFREMAGFLKNCSKPVGYSSDNEPSYGGMYGIDKLLSEYEEFMDSCIFGLPSTDRRGPQIKSRYSVGITSCCSDQDAAKRFVKTLLSYDVQLHAAYYDEVLTVNRKALNKYAEELIDMYDLNEKNIGEAIKDHMNEIINSANSPGDSDSEILKIVNEEIQPFLAGDKDLDEVIRLINSRGQLILDER